MVRAAWRRHGRFQVRRAAFISPGLADFGPAPAEPPPSPAQGPHLTTPSHQTSAAPQRRQAPAGSPSVTLARRRQRSLRRNFENAPAGLWRTKGRTWDPRPELPPEAGFMRRSCALDDNRSFLTIVRAARHEQPAVPASFVRIPPRRRYGVSQGARTADGVGTKYGACACTGLEGPSEN